MRQWKLCSAVLLAILASGCGASKRAPVTVVISPTTATVVLQGTLQFVASVNGTSKTDVTWSVNDVVGGNSTVGTISTAGLYTAPKTVPNPATVTVKATSVADPMASASAQVTLDSGIGISVSPSGTTLGTSETFQFTAKVTGTTNSSVTWSVNDVVGGNPTVGTVSGTGLYTAPATMPSPSTVTVKATSVADITRSASASVGLITADDPRLTAIHPATAAQGSVFQDVYLTGTNFRSTSTVQVNGTLIPTTFVSTLLLRARIPDALLGTAGTFDVAVKRQSGFTTPACTPDPAACQLVVVPVRPVLVGASPDSGTQDGATFSLTLNGGYYSPSVTAEFDGQLHATTLLSSRQLNVPIGAPDLTSAGLFSVVVRNSAVSQPMAAVNLAVQPLALPTLVTSVSVGAKPSAVAINTATGIAVVANHDSNSISLIDLTLPTPAVSGAPIAVGTGPTGVAVDNERNLAVVVNNGSNSVSVVDLSTATVTPITQNVGTAPFAVGVNPLTGLALVAYQSTNQASIIDLTTKTVIGTVAVSTVANPAVGIEPRLNWAIVTPGGVGSLSIVDLGRRTVSAIAPPASNGAVRSSNVVTITTTASHGLAAGEPVLITGASDSSFNGTFTVSSVPSTTTFTYAQTGPNAASGNGSAIYARPVATATVGTGVRGIAINTETAQAVLADPTASSVVLFSLLDQTVRLLPLEASHVAAAVNPLTDIGVTLESTTNQASVLDLRTPTRLATVPVGIDPRAVAIDPGSNVAVVVNEGSNDVSILSLGAIRSLHITQISPATTFTSSTDLPLSVTGNGFVSGSAVRLDGTSVPTTGVSANGRHLTATIPAAMLAGPRRYVVDVLSPGGTQSNISNLIVMQAVAVGTAPRAVAIDPERNLAVVTNTGDNTISVVDLSTGTASAPIAVGTNPQGVAVLPRLGKAVVTNRGSNNASIVDLVAGKVTSTVTAGTEPIGVAINPDTATAVVANRVSNNLTLFNADTGQGISTLLVDQQPVAVAVDPVRNLVAVGHASPSPGVALVDLGQGSVKSRVPNLQFPTGLVFDPVSDRLLALASLTNNFVIVDPDTLQITPVRTGINPTSIAYNFQSSTLVTVNSASHTVSVMDFLDRRVRALLGLDGSQQFSVEIHPRTNLAVIVDESNNRVLLVPLPR